MVPNKRLYECPYLLILVTICLTGTISKILALPSHMIKNKLMTSKIVKCSAHNIIEFSGPSMKSLSLKMTEILLIL